MKFCTKVHALIKEAVEQANQDFVKTSQRYELREVSGCYTGPLHAGEFACNPIAYELRGNGKTLSETLVVELTRDGLIQAFLVPHPHVLEIPRASNALGWHPVPLPMFGAADASNLVVWRDKNAVADRSETLMLAICRLQCGTPSMAPLTFGQCDVPARQPMPASASTLQSGMLIA